MSIFRDGRRVGDYLAQNLSSGGALLANGPPIDPGARVELIVRVHGGCTLQLHATTIRTANSHERDGKIAVTFHGVQPDQEDLIHSALLQALERGSEASIIAVHRSVATLGLLAESVSAIGKRPVLAYTPLDAILWLCDPDTRVDAALIDSELDASQTATLLGFLKDEFPSVRRVVVHGKLNERELTQLLSSSDAQAALGLPSTPSRLHAVLHAPV